MYRDLVDNKQFNFPNMLREGVVYFNEEPIYIVELIEMYNSNSDATITVYEAVKAEDDVVKAYFYKDRTSPFTEHTKMSRMALAAFKQGKKHKQKVEDRPIFIAPIEFGTDTFTGVQGEGFFELTKMVPSLDGNKKYRVNGGDKTGVFIALDSIRWRKRAMATGEAVRTYQVNKLVFGQ